MKTETIISYILGITIVIIIAMLAIRSRNSSMRRVSGARIFSTSRRPAIATKVPVQASAGVQQAIFDYRDRTEGVAPIRPV